MLHIRPPKEISHFDDLVLWYVDIKWNRHSGERKRTSQTEVVIEGKKRLRMRADGNACVRRWGLWGSEESHEKLGWDGKPEKRQNVRTHLRASRDKKGSLGVQGLLLGLPNPQAQPSLQGMPQIWLSGSPRGRPRSASRFNMLCVPAPPAPLHLNHHCPRAGPPLPASRSLLKAPFKPGDVFG